MDSQPPDPEREAEQVHKLLQPLREHVERVSSDFGTRVAHGIEDWLRTNDKRPTLLGFFSRLVSESMSWSRDVAAPAERDGEDDPKDDG